MHSSTGSLWMLEIAVLLSSAKLMEGLFVRIGLPRVVGYIVVGLIAAAFNYQMSEATRAFAIVGITTMLFYAGLESSAREFMRGLKDSGVIAVGGVIGSLAFGYLCAELLGLEYTEALGIGVALSATSVSLTIKTLEELNKLGGREAQAIIGAAVVDDVIGLALLSVLIGVAEGRISVIEITEISILAFAFWLAVSFVFQAISKSLFRMISRLRAEAILLTTLFSILMLFSYIAAYIKLSSILLAYALGLGIASFRYFARKLSKEIYPIVALFTPLFFVYTGGLVKFSEIIEIELHRNVTFILVIVICGLLSKIIGCGIVAKLRGFNIKESLIIGIGMTPRAEVMLTAAMIGYEMGLFSLSSYIGLLAIIPVSTLITPPLLKYLYTKGSSI